MDIQQISQMKSEANSTFSSRLDKLWQTGKIQKIIDKQIERWIVKGDYNSVYIYWDWYLSLRMLSRRALGWKIPDVNRKNIFLKYVSIKYRQKGFYTYLDGQDQPNVEPADLLICVYEPTMMKALKL